MSAVQQLLVATGKTVDRYIPTPAATPAIGAAFEGGFYAGMIWLELAQSSTTVTIGTGVKVFDVPAMATAPLVYLGQIIEVYANNKAYRMNGAVTDVSGTSLTLNVTAISASGTFSNWKIIARHRVIVAPKASGENTNIQYKNTGTASPVETKDLTDGRKATLAMVAAGTSAVYPAAHWCNNLDINGKTDWYMPARDELELCWRNLKPTTDNNYAGNNSGANVNSDPAGAAYTSTNPARTAVTAFRTGGSEAFIYPSATYWSSTEGGLYNQAWSQRWDSPAPGDQLETIKQASIVVRAVRRSII